MKKNLQLFFCSYLFILPAHAQEKEFKRPDYKKIEKEIKKEDPPFYYPVLLKRFTEADSAMILDEKQHLYYGYPFHEKYVPYGNVSVYSDSLHAASKKKFTEKDYEKIARLTDSIISADPFNLDAYYNAIWGIRSFGEA